ncbi:MAG: hypothetical protein R3F59_21410 [Myxococcota bacterium]
MSDEVEPTEAELRQVLAHRTGGATALQQGLALAGRTAAIGLPAALVYGIVSGGVGYAVQQLALDALETDPGRLQSAAQIFLIAGGLAAVYTVIQFTKRKTASRASWAPALFTAPLLMGWGSLWLMSSTQASQMRPMAVQLMVIGWSLLWMSFGGAAVAIAWLRSGRGRSSASPSTPRACSTRCAAARSRSPGPTVRASTPSPSACSCCSPASSTRYSSRSPT